MHAVGIFSLKKMSGLSILLDSNIILKILLSDKYLIDDDCLI